MRRKLAVALALGLIAAAPLTPTSARAQSSNYVLPLMFQWEKSDIDVVVIPPEHGQIYNADGTFGGQGTGELTPNNTYMKAIEAALADWNKAIQQFGSTRLKEALNINIYVLGRDPEAAGLVATAEIVVMTDQGKGPVLGYSLTGTSCYVLTSKRYVSSFSYEDMYNTAGHEYGHCLGLFHVVDDEPVDDMMNGHYPHNIGAKDNPLHCASNLDVLGIENSIFGGADEVTMAPGDWKTIDCSSSQLGGRRHR